MGMLLYRRREEEKKKKKAEKFDGEKPVEVSKAENDILLEAEAVEPEAETVEPEAEAVDEKSDEKKSAKKREK